MVQHHGQPGNRQPGRQFLQHLQGRSVPAGDGLSKYVRSSDAELFDP